MEIPDDVPKIRGYDFENGRDLDGLMDSMLQTGFQATNLGLAIKEVNRMVRNLIPGILFGFSFVFHFAT